MISSTPAACSRDHRPAEEVLDADAPDAVGVDAPVEQVGHRRDRADVEVEGQGGVDDAPDGAARSARHRDEEASRPVAATARSMRLQAAVDAQPGDDLAGQRRVVVEEADRQDAGARMAPGRPGHQHARLAGPVQERGPLVGRGRAWPAPGFISEAARIPNRTPPRIATLRSSSISQNERGNPSGQVVPARIEVP